MKQQWMDGWMKESSETNNSPTYPFSAALDQGCLVELVSSASPTGSSSIHPSITVSPFSFSNLLCVCRNEA